MKKHTPKNEQEIIHAELEKLQQHNKEYLDTLQRLQADFENHKKRTIQEQEHHIKFAAHNLIHKLLPLLDTLDNALKTRPDDAGILMIYKQLFSLLESEGLHPMDTIGKQFDPYLHEVIKKEPSEKDEGVIIEEIQKGYKLHDKVLRHSKVIISSGPETSR